MIGIGAENSVRPVAVRRVGAWFPVASKIREVAIGDPCSFESGCQGVALEVGKATRAWKASDISQQLDIVLSEQCQEVFETADGMAEGKDGKRHTGQDNRLQPKRSPDATTRVGPSCLNGRQRTGQAGDRGLEGSERASGT